MSGSSCDELLRTVKAHFLYAIDFSSKAIIPAFPWHQELVELFVLENVTSTLHYLGLVFAQLGREKIELRYSETRQSFMLIPSQTMFKHPADLFPLIVLERLTGFYFSPKSITSYIGQGGSS